MFLDVGAVDVRILIGRAIIQSPSGESLSERVVNLDKMHRSGVSCVFHDANSNAS
jgi:hypothetical protein